MTGNTWADRWKYYPPEALRPELERELGYEVRALQRGGVTVIGNALPTQVRPGDLILSTGYDPATGGTFFSLFRPDKEPPA
jgi:hypothetical protein